MSVTIAGYRPKKLEPVQFGGMLVPGHVCRSPIPGSVRVDGRSLGIELGPHSVREVVAVVHPGDVVAGPRRTAGRSSGQRQHCFPTTSSGVSARYPAYPHETPGAPQHLRARHRAGLGLNDRDIPDRGARAAHRTPAGGSAGRCARRRSPLRRVAAGASASIAARAAASYPETRTAVHCSARSALGRSPRSGRCPGSSSRWCPAGGPGWPAAASPRRPTARPGCGWARARRKARSLWLNCWTTS